MVSKQTITIEIVSGPRAGEQFTLTPGGSFAIGRGSENTLTIDDDLLSRSHARIDYRDSGVWLSDLGSSNGTFHNANRLEHEEELTNGSRVRIGTTTFRIAMTADSPQQTVPFQAVARLHMLKGPLAGQDFPLFDSPVRIGRQPDNDISVEDSRISRYHARIGRRGDTFWVQDLGSSNGTHVNEKRIMHEKPLADGDLIQIGPLTITAILPNQNRAAMRTELDTPVMLDDLPLEDTFTLPTLDNTEDAAGFLSILSGTFQGEIYPIKGAVHIGREPSNEIVLKDEGVSSLHAQITVDEDALWLEDSGSRNGTRVNGERISAPHRLKPGDRIRIGVVTAAFEATLEKAQAVQAARSPGRIVTLTFGTVFVLLAIAIALFVIRWDARALSAREIDEVARSVVQLYAVDEVTNPLQPLWVGSGTIISADGQILTNCHVACDAPLIVVLITNDVESPPVPRYLAEVSARSEELDLALITVTTDMAGTPVGGDLGLSPLNIDTRGTESVGDPLYIFGYPTAGGLTITITTGAVSGFEADLLNGVEQRVTIKTDAKIASGNSGGAAINGKGALIGVPTTVNTDERTNESIPLIRPAALIDFLRD